MEWVGRMLEGGMWVCMYVEGKEGKKEREKREKSKRENEKSKIENEKKKTEKSQTGRVYQDERKTKKQ